MYRIAVTNRHLCEGDFLERIRQIAQGDEYNAILLREKDLSHEEYEELAGKVLKITNQEGKKCILHTDYRAALSLSHPFVHVPLSVMAQMSQKEREKLRNSVKEMSTSIHSLEQLKRGRGIFNGFCNCRSHICYGLQKRFTTERIIFWKIFAIIQRFLSMLLAA